MNPVLIAVGGGPCGGKTTFLAKATEFLTGRGFQPFIVQESATLIMSSGFPRSKDEWFEANDFQREVLREAIYLERSCIERIKRLKSVKQKVVLCDRGWPDVIAYAGKDSFATLLSECGQSYREAFTRYSLMIHLVTAADGAEKFYTCSNNATRTESPEEARLIDRKIQEAWSSHPNRIIIPNRGDFEMKINEALKALSRVLSPSRLMPSQEHERSFFFENFREDVIPPTAVKRLIKQTYLTELIPHHERRVREELCDGGVTYYFTEKVGDKRTGSRGEIQRIISQDEMNEYLRSRDHGESIVKTRYSFAYNNRHFEVDRFHWPITDLSLVEVEHVSSKDRIEFPPEWGMMKEVTGDERYGNYAIAHGSLKSAV